MSTEDTLPPVPERRADDPRVVRLVADVADLKQEMARNTAVTEQVRDILATFKTLGAIAKWVTAIAGAIAAIFAAAKTGR